MKRGDYLAGDFQPNKDIFGRWYALTVISENGETNETSETLCKELLSERKSQYISKCLKPPIH